MKSPFKLTTASLVLTLAAATAAFSAEPADNTNPPPPHERGGRDRGPSLESLAERLGLNADQKEKIGALLKKRREEGDAIRNDPALTREQKMEKGRALREEGAKEIEALLTPEQIKKFHEMREEMRARGPRHGGDGQPPPPPADGK